MRVHLATLGCRLNEAELETWALGFKAHGFSVVNEPRFADLYVLNSCAVTGEAAKKSRQTIARFHRINPDAKIIVSGCYATLKPVDAAQLLGVDLVVSNRDKEKLVELVVETALADVVATKSEEPHENPLFSRGRTRAFVKVQDGCRNRCSFCIVTVARGEERSVALDDIVSTINHHHANGIQEVILTGVHLGGYGGDIGSDLLHLIQAVLEKTKVPRIRLGSLEPWDIPSDFFLLWQNPRLMPHLHLPLQSGSDSVLKRMARRCMTGDFSRLVNDARKCIPDVNITTDVIVGFPGETDDEWRQSIEYIERIGFGHVHIFSYSPREGTKAARMPGQLASDIKAARSKELHCLAQTMKERFLTSMVGRSANVLFERDETTSAFSPTQRIFPGYTPNYARILCATSADDSLTNQIATVKIDSHNDSNLHGVLVQKND